MVSVFENRSYIKALKRKKKEYEAFLVSVVLKNFCFYV